MIKDFSTVAHLYLGCEVVIHNDQPKRRVVRTLFGFAEPERISAITMDGIRNRGQVNMHFLKPILRKIESITFEEFIEAGKIHVSCGGVIQITFDDVKANRVLPTYPEVFAWLLSKHFDLFNLIDNNLAISKE